MKITNMTNDNGKAIANQFIITDPENYTVYFQSYESIIVKKVFLEGRQKIYLDKTYWNYSKTTSKYRSRFLGETTAMTKGKIKIGEYILTNLN